MPRTSATEWRTFLIPAALALAGYLLFYACDSRLRSQRGPWEVVYISHSNGEPALAITQPALGIRSVQVRFVAETNPAPELVNRPAVVRFDNPDVAVPFGTVAFTDLMYLPGTVVLHCFGHEVQMLPRGLFLNREEFRWSQPGPHLLHPTNRLPSLDPPPRTVLGRVRPDPLPGGEGPREDPPQP